MAHQHRPGARALGPRRSRDLVALVAVLAVLATAIAAATTATGAAAQSGGAPGIGTAVPFVGTEGSTLAEITIEAAVDPFEDYDPNTPPQRAYHFVLLTVSVENSGSRPLAFDPNAIAVQDAEGFLSRPLYLPRTEESLDALPDYPAGEIPPGESATGALAYQTLNGAALRTIVYLPTADRLVVLASLAGSDGAAGSSAAASGEADNSPATLATPATEDAGTGAGADPTADADAVAGADADPAAGADTAASGLDCALAEEWATGTGARLDEVSLLVAELETFDRATADPVRLGEIAEEFQALADEQAAAEIPPELTAANDEFVAAYEAFAAAFDLVAQAAEDGDIDAVAAEANADVSAANTVLSEAGDLAQSELAACGLS